MALQLGRDRLEHGVTGGMAVAVVHRLEAVEIEIDQRRAGAVALDVSERPLELALEAAAVENVGQWVDIDARLEIGDTRPRCFKLRGKPIDLGGDEFAVLLWNIGGAEAAAKAAALEAAVYATPVSWGASTFVVGASAGVAPLGPLDSLADVLTRADAAMYARKSERKEAVSPRARGEENEVTR